MSVEFILMRLNIIEQSHAGQHMRNVLGAILYFFSSIVETRQEHHRQALPWGNFQGEAQMSFAAWSGPLRALRKSTATFQVAQKEMRICDEDVWSSCRLTCASFSFSLLSTRFFLRGGGANLIRGITKK